MIVIVVPAAQFKDTFECTHGEKRFSINVFAFPEALDGRFETFFSGKALRDIVALCRQRVSDALFHRIRATHSDSLPRRLHAAVRF